MNDTSELTTLREMWISESHAGNAELPAGKLAMARVGERMSAVIVALIALGSLLLIGVALSHASNRLERSLGLLSAIGVVVATIGYVAGRAADRRTLSSPVNVFLAARVSSLERSQRLAIFLFANITVVLLFLLVWWWGGFVGKHVHTLLQPITFMTFWLPLVTMLGVGLWSVHLWREARSELPRIRAIQSELANDRHEIG